MKRFEKQFVEALIVTIPQPRSDEGLQFRCSDFDGHDFTLRQNRHAEQMLDYMVAEREDKESLDLARRIVGGRYGLEGSCAAVGSARLFVGRT